jgi:hypothetical protein
LLRRRNLSAISAIMWGTPKIQIAFAATKMRAFMSEQDKP